MQTLPQISAALTYRKQLSCLPSCGLARLTTCTVHTRAQRTASALAMFSPLGGSVDRKRVRSYGSQSIDSGVEDSDTSAFVLVLDSALQSPVADSATATGVAIDNKIEQAMDLVKSHLMLAVREEVEDLKLQIKQLIERNSQLEQENKLLRSSAAPETMAQLALLNRQQNH